MNIKLILIAGIAFSALTLAVPAKSYADYLPQAYVDSVMERKELPEISSDLDFGNFIISHNPRLQKNIVYKIAFNVNKYSNENNVDPKLVLALMARESSFRSNAVSRSGAIGLGQLKRATARDMGVKDPFNIIDNIKGTVKYLGWLLKRNDGDVDLTLASYNMGPGAVKRAKEAGITLPEKVEKYVSDIKNFLRMI